MTDHYPLFLAGRWLDTGEKLQVQSPWDGRVVATVARAGEKELEEAARAAEEAFEKTRRAPTWEREEILRKAADRLEGRAEEFARTLVLEAGKPIRFARAEVARAVHTLRLSAGRASRITGKIIPIDTAPWGTGKIGFVRYVPAGPVAAISPFNFPLNLSLHKVGPAVAAGNPSVLKPASSTPVTACKLASLFEEAGAPAGWLSVVPCDRNLGERLVEDPRFKVLSFTGSPAAGWEIRKRAGRKKVALELGGNAAVILHEDADLVRAIPKIVTAAYGFAGQSCISVQRILVHAGILGEVRERLLAEIAEVKAGDPMEEDTTVGPLITEKAADRVMEWIGRAREAGAEVLCGGERDGNLIQPTLLEKVPREAEVDRLEVFGPVANLHAYEDFDAALAQVNDSIYGLQAGLFTSDMGRIMRTWEEVEVGGLVVNDVPTFRVDSMPYGGVKESGAGREGPEWAMEHMTEPRLLVLHLP